MYRKKTVRERAEEAEFSEVLSGDYIRMMKLDPIMAKKYLADQAAGDVQKYSNGPMGSKYSGFENTLNSPITPMNRCRFCESEERGGKKLLRCSSCKAVRYIKRTRRLNPSEANNPYSYPGGHLLFWRYSNLAEA